MSSEPCVIHDYNLPDNSEQLKKVEVLINKYKKRLKLIQTQRIIDDKTHTEFYEDIIKVLDYVGRLSMPAFDIRDEMEAMYTKAFINSPELGKKLFLDHYENVHHPYNLYKNRCFKLLEDLDAVYYKINKKRPPNWNV